MEAGMEGELRGDTGVLTWGHNLLSNLGWRIMAALPFRNVLILPHVSDNQEETNSNNEKCSRQETMREESLDNNNVGTCEFEHNIREPQQTIITPTRTPTLRTDTSRTPTPGTSTLVTPVSEKSSSGTSTLVKSTSGTGISISDKSSLGTPTTPNVRRPTLRIPTLRTPTVRQFSKEQILGEDIMEKVMSEGEKLMEDKEHESITETQMKYVLNEMETDLETKKQSSVMQHNIIRQTNTKHSVQTLNSRTHSRRRETILKQETLDTQNRHGRDNLIPMKSVCVEQNNVKQQSVKEEDQVTGGNLPSVTVNIEEKQTVDLAVEKPVEQRSQVISSEMLKRNINQLVRERGDEKRVEQAIKERVGQMVEEREREEQIEKREGSNRNGEVKRTGRKRGKKQTHNIELNNPCDGVRITQVKVVFVPNDSDKEIRDVVERGISPPKKVLKKDSIDNSRKRRSNLNNEKDTPEVMNVNFITVDPIKDEHKENVRETDSKELEWKQRIKKGKHKLLSMKQTSILCLPVDSNSPSSLSSPLSPVTFLEVHQSTPSTLSVREKTNKCSKTIL